MGMLELVLMVALDGGVTMSGGGVVGLAVKM